MPRNREEADLFFCSVTSLQKCETRTKAVRWLADEIYDFFIGDPKKSEGRRRAIESRAIDILEGHIEKYYTYRYEVPPYSGKNGNIPLSFARGRALIIGIANYPRISKLPGVMLKDARDVANLLRSEDQCGYPPTNVKLLLDEEATAQDIRQGLRWLAQTSAPEDTGVVFFSGHGGRKESGPDAGTYLIPFDYDPNRLRDTAMGSEELTALLSAVKAQRLVVLLDACHSAGAGEVKALDAIPDIKAGLDEKTYNLLAQGTGRVIMASSQSNEASLILHGMQNSLFTHYLLEALKGACRTDGDGLIRVIDVCNYVSVKMPDRATTQHPIFKAHDLENNFPLALQLGGKHVSVTGTPSVAPSSILPGKTLPAPLGPVEVFYSYAHKDEPLLDELLKHLGILKRLGVIRDWHDRKITPGAEWKGQIDEHLDAAGVILLLVSVDFVASDYCWDVELKRALQRHDHGEARVIPVILRHVDNWHAAPFGKLQAVPTNGRPVIDWPTRDEAFEDVARHVRRAVEELRNP